MDEYVNALSFSSYPQRRGIRSCVPCKALRSFPSCILQGFNLHPETYQLETPNMEAKYCYNNRLILGLLLFYICTCIQVIFAEMEGVED